MVYTWFKIFNTTEFDALGLVSKNYQVVLEGIGLRDILVTKGSNYGITYEGIFLPYDLNDQNPFYFEDHAICLNTDGYMYLGIGEEE